MRISIFVIFILIAFSCDLEENENPVIVIPESLQIREVTRNGIVKSDYAYDDDDKIVTVRFYDNTGVFSSKSDYDFLAEKTVVKSFDKNQDPLLTSEYYEVDPLITRQDRFDAQGNLLNYFLYHYESANSCIYFKREEFSESDELISNLKYTFLDDNCSFESIKTNENGSLISTIRFIHDGKKRFNNAAANPKLPISAGNIMEYSYADADGEVLPSSSYTSTFEYNASNYPIKETRFLLDGEIEEYLFSYFQ